MNAPAASVPLAPAAEPPWVNGRVAGPLSLGIWAMLALGSASFALAYGHFIAAIGLLWLFNAPKLAMPRRASLVSPDGERIVSHLSWRLMGYWRGVAWALVLVGGGFARLGFLGLILGLFAQTLAQYACIGSVERLTVEIRGQKTASLWLVIPWFARAHVGELEVQWAPSGEELLLRIPGDYFYACYALETRPENGWRARWVQDAEESPEPSAS